MQGSIQTIRYNYIKMKLKRWVIKISEIILYIYTNRLNSRECFCHRYLYNYQEAKREETFGLISCIRFSFKSKFF